MSDSIKEALKEAGRLIVLAVVSVVVTVALKYFSDVPETETTAIILVLLRGVDKWLHESGKATSGLTRF